MLSHVPMNCTNDFLIARNSDEMSSLPRLVRIPLGEPGFVVKSMATWPATSKVYCHRAEAWPDHANLVDRFAHGVRSSEIDQRARSRAHPREPFAPARCLPDHASAAKALSR